MRLVTIVYALFTFQVLRSTSFTGDMTLWYFSRRICLSRGMLGHSCERLLAVCVSNMFHDAFKIVPDTSRTVSVQASFYGRRL